MIATLLSMATRFTHEVCHVERDESSSAGDGEVELLTVRRLTMSGLVCAERVEPAPPEDPRNNRVDVGVEVDGKRRSAPAP